MLAWPSPDNLFLVEANGAVHHSADQGVTWNQVGSTGATPTALAFHDSDFYAALETNEIAVSRDGGRSWQPRIAS